MSSIVVIPSRACLTSSSVASLLTMDERSPMKDNTNEKEPECLKKNAARIAKKEQVRQEIERIPDFTKKTDSEIEAWIKE